MGKSCKDTSILHTLHRFSTSISALMQTLKMFSFIFHQEKWTHTHTPRPPSFHHRWFFFFPFCCQRRQSCTNQAQVADCVSNKCQDSFPLRPPFPFLQLHWEPLTTAEAGGRRATTQERRDPQMHRRRRPEVSVRRGITPAAALLQADVSPGHLPRTDNNKENREGRRWLPRSEFLLLPLRCSQPKQRPQCKQRQNVRLWQGGGERPPSPSLAAAAGAAHRRLPTAACGPEGKLTLRFTYFAYVNKVFSSRCCHTTSPPESRDTLP